MKRHVLPITILTLAAAWGGTQTANAKPSVTVFPVVTAPDRFPDELAKRVGTVVATLLEKAGLEELEVADTLFDPPESDDINKIADAFGKHVRKNPIQTDYAVFAQFLGTPAIGVKGIHTIVVDKTGQVVFAEFADEAQLDAAPVPPKDPMTCCVFVSQRLVEFWKLADPLRPDAPEGKMARFWKEDAGIPDKPELDAITKRGQMLKKNIKSATSTIYPVRVGGQSNQQCARDLVAMLNERGLGKAEASDTDPALTIAGHSNEQKVLWDTARAFREFVKANRPTTDYAVYADYGIRGTNVRYVHVVICDQLGDWVLLDFQNSHHPDFERIDPKLAADCNDLLLVRLNGWLRE